MKAQVVRLKCAFKWGQKAKGERHHFDVGMSHKMRPPRSTAQKRCTQQAAEAYSCSSPGINRNRKPGRHRTVPVKRAKLKTVGRPGLAVKRWVVAKKKKTGPGRENVILPV